MAVTEGCRVLVSVGYEGRSAERFVELLTRNGVSILIDVRLNAISRKAGFSKGKLAAVLAEAGVEYMHEPLLGNPPENRDAFRAGGNLKRARATFAARLSNGAAEALAGLIEMASERTVAVLCVERDAERCHRKVITDEAQELRPSLVVLEV